MYNSSVLTSLWLLRAGQCSKLHRAKPLSILRLDIHNITGDGFEATGATVIAFTTDMSSRAKTARVQHSWSSNETSSAESFDKYEIVYNCVALQNHVLACRCTHPRWQAVIILPMLQMPHDFGTTYRYGWGWGPMLQVSTSVRVMSVLICLKSHNATFTAVESQNISNTCGWYLVCDYLQNMNTGLLLSYYITDDWIFKATTRPATMTRPDQSIIFSPKINSVHI